MVWFHEVTLQKAFSFLFLQSSNSTHNLNIHITSSFIFSTSPRNSLKFTREGFYQNFNSNNVNKSDRIEYFLTKYIFEGCKQIYRENRRAPPGHVCSKKKRKKNRIKYHLKLFSGNHKREKTKKGRRKEHSVWANRAISLSHCTSFMFQTKWFTAFWQ